MFISTLISNHSNFNLLKLLILMILLFINLLRNLFQNLLLINIWLISNQNRFLLSLNNKLIYRLLILILLRLEYIGPNILKIFPNQTIFILLINLRIFISIFLKFFINGLIIADIQFFENSMVFYRLFLVEKLFDILMLFSFRGLLINFWFRSWFAYRLVVFHSSF